ncbi:MAG: SsrA-binding protein SmpB [Candidatus Lightella neohaematopini]|nr:SsrA-binding protein SmpB [Candidatus Lightella neohaematopini]MCV2529010.1 SsrA-binding protein SmpB [Candidatus Lightella neohaematopini]
MKVNKNNIICIKNNISINYVVYKEINAGIILYGWEIKSLKKNKINIKYSYVTIIDKEAYLINSEFQPLITSNISLIDIKRNRKLLLKKYELYLLSSYIKQKGYTIIPLVIFWKKHLVKIKIGVVKGKKSYDKRMDIKRREWIITKNRNIKKFM